MEEKRNSFNTVPSAPNYLNAIKNVDNIKLIDQSQSLDNLNMNASPEQNSIFFAENNKKNEASHKIENIDVMDSNSINNVGNENQNRNPSSNESETKKSGTSSSYNSSKQKKITFTIDYDRHKNSFLNEENQNDIDFKATNIYDKLSELKKDEIRKNRMKPSLPKSQVKKKKKCRRLNLCCFDTNNIKKELYNLFERPSGLSGFIYRLFTFTVIFGSIIIGALTTVESLDDWSFIVCYYYEIFVIIYFGLEYVLRVWSCCWRETYQGVLGRMKFITRPLLIIEFLLITTSICILSLGSEETITHQVIFKSTALSALRFFQIIRFLYIDRHAQTWKILIKVIYKHRFELLSCVYLGVIVLMFSSYMILIFEKPYSEEADDNHFHSYADAIYWSIITMTTIGYGDRSPRTFYGKIVATSLCILGVAFWTLPGGIIGTGFAILVEQKNKKKQFNRLVPAATKLIQAWWRMKATLFISTSNAACLVATVSTFDISKPIFSKTVRRLRDHLNSSSSGHDELASLFTGLDSGYDNKKRGNIKEQILSGVTNLSSRSSGSFSQSNYGDDSTTLAKLSPEHLILIRTILLLKYFAARQKFKLAYKPYDFKDVIEQYTQGNVDILSKMKDLQRKIDQITIDRRFTNNFLYANPHHPPPPPLPLFSQRKNQLSSQLSWQENYSYNKLNKENDIFNQEQNMYESSKANSSTTIDINNRFNQLESKLEKLEILIKESLKKT